MVAVRVIIAAVLALFLIAGLRRGLIRQVLEVVGLIVAFIAAFYFAYLLAGRLSAEFGLDYGIALKVAGVVLFIAIIVLFHWIGIALQKLFKMTVLGLFDHVAGAVFGLVKGLLLISLALVIVLAAPFPKEIKDRILEDPVTASIYPILPVLFDEVVTRLPGGERFDEIARIGGSETLEKTTRKLRRDVEKAGEEIGEKAGELGEKAKDSAGELKDKATD